MTEHLTPARIWAEDTRDYGSWFDHPNETHPIAFVRSDIAERMAEALEALVADVEDYERINNLSPSPGKADCWQSVTRAKSALSAFRSATQDTEARG